ncbi:MAG TPA: hypothetical protein VEG65_04340 [Candidatus Bathyarchaeia archaeon]|nr:hypothetical protein [Candidatus Bathyarchaeia archaeon]
MLRKITIVLIMFAVLVVAMPLAATSALAANSPRQTSDGAHLLTVPFAGTFAGKTVSRTGGRTDTGTGVFLWCGWSKVTGSQALGTQYPQPYFMGITTLAGTIRLEVAPGSNVYQIDGGTGCFAHVVGGTGHFSICRSSHGTFSGSLDGTIVFA